MTVEAIPMDRAEAQRITERIRLKLDSVAAGMDALGALVADAYQRRADLALGYETWADYADAEFAEQTRNLAAPIRRELVGKLTEAGMSTRAIAPAVGSPRETVRRDVVKLTQSGSPDPLAEEKAEGRVVKLTGPGSLLHSEPAEHIDHATGEVLTGPVVAPLAPSGKVMGLDGKTYTRPEPAAPRRRPLPDQAQDAAINLTAAIERVARVFADDRYPQNREQVAAVTRSHLLRTAKVCQDLASQLPN